MGALTREAANAKPAEMDWESQDAVLAELDAKERNEILQKLGRGND